MSGTTPTLPPQEPEIDRAILAAFELLYLDGYISAPSHQAATLRIQHEPKESFEDYPPVVAWLIAKHVLPASVTDQGKAGLAVVAWMYENLFLSKEATIHAIEGISQKQDELRTELIFLSLTSGNKQRNKRVQLLLKKRTLNRLRGAQLLNDLQLIEAERLLETAPAHLDDSLESIWFWLLTYHVLPPAAANQAIDELLERLDDDTPETQQWLNELNTIAPHKVEAHRLKPRKRNYRTPLLAGALALAMAVVAYAVYALLPDSTPLCTDPKIVQTVSAQVKSGQPSILRQLPSNAGSIDITGHQEAGYDLLTKARGCVAKLGTQKDAFPVGYVIEPAAAGQKGFNVTLLPAGYVQARYSTEGRNPQLGAPIGRDALVEAFMLTAGKDSNILSVIPRAHCSQLAEDIYSCPMQIYFLDETFASSGGDSITLLNANFTFVREQGQWQASYNFPRELTLAIISGRIRASEGEAAAEAFLLKAIQQQLHGPQ